MGHTKDSSTRGPVGREYNEGASTNVGKVFTARDNALKQPRS